MAQVQAKDYAGKVKDLSTNINRAVRDLRIQKRLEALEKRVAELEAKG